ncbi:hypothetical protein D1007_08367 [Hordeum vulgare]|nr:hypothetical protein D1007_08367 [Hordeum vulgare]
MPHGGSHPLEYDQWQVRFHDEQARLNFRFPTAPFHLIPPAPRVVNAAMEREDWEASEHLEAEAVDESTSLYTMEGGISRCDWLNLVKKDGDEDEE